MTTSDTTLSANPPVADNLGLEIGTPQPISNPAPAAASMDNWQSRFAGLQRSVQDVMQQRGYQRFADIPASTEVEQLRAQAQQLPTIAADVERLTAERGAFEQQVATLQAQINGLQAKTTLFEVVAEVAPDLVPFVNYLPQAATREEIVAQVEAFRGKLKTVGTVNPGPNTPLPPPSSPQAGVQPTLADLNRQFNEARAKRDTVAMRTLGDQIRALQK